MGESQGRRAYRLGKSGEVSGICLRPKTAYGPSFLAIFNQTEDKRMYERKTATVLSAMSLVIGLAACNKEDAAAGTEKVGGRSG